MINIEQKLHITLSPYTFSILESDSRAFSNIQSFSGLINRIILNYYEESTSSISRHLEAERMRINKTIRSGIDINRRNTKTDISINSEIEKYVNAYIQGYVNQIKDKKKAAFSKGISKIIYLNKDVFSILFPDENNIDNWPEFEYYPRQNSYIKALLDDYASQPLYLRERIIFKDTIETLETILNVPSEKRGLLRISTSKTNADNQIYYVKPYKLLSDPESRYTYLCGMTSPTSSGNYRLASLRISRINGIKHILNNADPITKNEALAIEEAVKTRGVAYLSGKTEDIIVKLTNNGLSKYNLILHSRPEYVKKEEKENGNTCLYFSCTPQQIKNYFLQFGKDAIVIHPSDLAEELMQIYKEAFEVYQELDK